jgi:hypothetical protein
MKRILPTSVLFAGLLYNAPSFSYNYLTCSGNNLKWSNDNVAMATYDMTTTEHNAVQYGVDRWNENPSNFRFSLSKSTLSAAKSKSNSNGVNEIYWVEEVNDGNSSGQALLRKKCSTGEILEADVIVSSAANRNVITSMSKSDQRRYDGDGRALQALTIHELGHVTGLGHENSLYNVMGDQYSVVHTNGSSIRFYAGEDASDGLVDLYGKNSSANIQDIAVSHWRFDEATDPADEYSDHKRTEIFDEAGTTRLSRSTVNGEPRYKVRSGQTVQVEFTYENLGETTFNVDLEFYLSTNQLISTADRLIASYHDMQLARDKAYTLMLKVKIPTGLTVGDTYSIGAYVDSKNEVTGEVTEANNMSYIDVIIVN